MIKWKLLKYYISIRPLYKISSDGRIVNRHTGLELKTYSDKDGYIQISLPLETNGNGTKMKRFAIHRLVAYNFVEGYDKGLTVNHMDGNKVNNRAKNLEWVSLSENVSHAYRVGLNSCKPPPESKGESNGRCKITIDIVETICKKILSGESNKKIFSDLSGLYPIEVSRIQIVENIRKKQNWTEVSDLFFRTEKIQGKRDLVIHPV